MKKLTLIKAVNNYNGSKSVGTLLIFAEKHEEGEFKDKNIVSWNPDPAFVPEDTAYQMDDEGRIDPVLVTKKMIRHDEIKTKIAEIANLGLSLNV